MHIDFTADSPIEHRLERVKNYTGETFEVSVDNSAEDEISVNSTVPYTSKSEKYADGEKFMNTMTFAFDPSSKALGIKISTPSGRSIDILVTR